MGGARGGQAGTAPARSLLSTRAQGVFDSGGGVCVCGGGERRLDARLWHAQLSVHAHSRVKSDCYDGI